MNYFFQKLLLLIAFVACGSMANAQFPNEKFGKPSSAEWDFVGWGDAVDADAIILCKTMKASYVLSDQMLSNNQSDSVTIFFLRVTPSSATRIMPTVMTIRKKRRLLSLPVI